MPGPGMGRGEGRGQRRWADPLDASVCLCLFFAETHAVQCKSCLLVGFCAGSIVFIAVSTGNIDVVIGTFEHSV